MEDVHEGLDLGEFYRFNWWGGLTGSYARPLQKPKLKFEAVLVESILATELSIFGCPASSGSMRISE